MAMHDDELLSRVHEDGAKGSIAGDDILGAFIGDLLVGIFVVDSLGVKTIGVHIGFLKGHRKLALGFAKDFIDLAFSGDIERVEAEIPTCWPDVIRFTEKVGFTKEGIKRAAYLKNGIMQDKQILGMTRGDYELRRE